jgi:heme/copper-type cytochrome/quinol oxidase subunit 2
VNRYLLTCVTLAAVGFWLFFSYWPSTPLVLPQLTRPAWLPGVAFQGLALFALVIFVVIQVMIIRSTVRLRNTAQVNAQESGVKFSFAAELLWTALPLLMTVGLAFITYQTWLSVAAP